MIANHTGNFDIGIASVGWCVLGEQRIINLGVRCFDKAETADKGESLVSTVLSVDRAQRLQLDDRVGHAKAHRNHVDVNEGDSVEPKPVVE